MIAIKTETGSVYMLDPDTRQAKRSSSTDRSGASPRSDDGWRKYDVVRWSIGGSLYIYWDKESTALFEASDATSWPATITSRVVSAVNTGDEG